MMKLYTLNRTRTVFMAFLLVFAYSCGEYFNDPLIDKKTGEEIDLFIIDPDLFKTKLSFKLVDSSSGQIITEIAAIKFGGQNANDIITFEGEKLENFYCTGLLYLTVDPTLSISQENPLKFIVYAEAENYLATSETIEITREGDKTIELKLSQLN